MKNNKANTIKRWEEVKPDETKLILERISDLYVEYFEVLESWKKAKTFKKIDRLRDIKLVFKELEIDWLDNI